MSRTAMLADLTDHLSHRRDVHVGRSLRVGIDGPSASGKTTLAGELADALSMLDIPVVRSGVDHFHRPRAERYRRGSTPRAYYEDSFDHQAMVEKVLVPLGPDGDGRCILAQYDFRTESAVPAVTTAVPPGTVLLFEGVFLFRPELTDHFDCRIFVDVPFTTALQRARDRDRELFGDPAAIERRYRQRYIPGQRLYFAACRPHDQAHVVIDNRHPDRPVVTWRQAST